MRHKEIKERGLEKAILSKFYVDKLPIAKISAETGVSVSAIHSFLREDKITYYNDDRLEAIATYEDSSPLQVISNYFQGVQHSSKELAFTALIVQMIREKVAKVIHEEDIEGLLSPSNKSLYNSWYRTTDKLSKLIATSQKQLEGYVTLFSHILDVQREVSYLKIITEIISKNDVELYRKIQRALDADPTSKYLLEALSKQDIIDYWDTPIRGMTAATVDTVALPVRTTARVVDTDEDDYEDLNDELRDT